MRDHTEICEYDNYTIPKCDPKLSDEERKRLSKEAEEKLKEFILQNVTKKTA